MNIQIETNPVSSTVEEESIEALWIGQNLRLYTRSPLHGYQLSTISSCKIT
jgi:hypothetical protein